VQAQHEHAARSDRSQFASVNHGRPNVVATPRPGAFNDRGVVHPNAAAASNTRSNARDSFNSSNARTNGGRNDRPSNATQTNASRGVNANRTNTTQPTNTSHSNTRIASSERPSNARTNAADHQTAQHSSTARPAQNYERSAPPQQHNSGPRQESRPQQKERDPHGKP
jgi:hypothetical protein